MPGAFSAFVTCGACSSYATMIDFFHCRLPPAVLLLHHAIALLFERVLAHAAIVRAKDTPPVSRRRDADARYALWCALFTMICFEDIRGAH